MDGGKDDRKQIGAAGGLLWRRGQAGLEIVIVHRSRYDDWSLPKGKLRPGESWKEAALREVREETGFTPRILSFAGAVAYETAKGPKLVRYWNMMACPEKSADPDSGEVAGVVWLQPAAAVRRLSYALERAIVETWAAEITSLPQFSE